MVERIAVTSGNGVLGEAVLSELDKLDYETINISRGKCREKRSDSYIRTDLLDAGNVYGAVAERSYFHTSISTTRLASLGKPSKPTLSATSGSGLWQATLPLTHRVRMSSRDSIQTPS